MKKRGPGVWKQRALQHARENVSDDGDEPQSGPPPAPAPAPEPIQTIRPLWLMAAGLPVLGGLAWRSLAQHSGDLRHTHRARLYALWPLGLLVLWWVVLRAGVSEWAADDIEGMGFLFWIVAASAWVGSLAEADREWRRLAGRGRPPEVTARWAVAPTKSKLIAWALWAAMGWCGGHRFYTGRWATGLLYCCTFGLLGMGWGYDLFRVASLVDEVNDNIRASDPGRVSLDDTPSAPKPPAWVEGARPPGALETLVRVGFFILAPGLLVLVALLSELEVVIALVGVVCVVSAAVGDVRRWLERWQDLEAVPLIGEGIVQLGRIHALYMRIPPRSIFFYLLYPLTALVTYRGSEQTREEVEVFGRLSGGLAVLVVLDAVLAWSGEDIAELGVFVLVFNVAFVVIALVSMISVGLAAITTAVRLNLTGHHRQLRGYTLLGLMTALPAWLLWGSMDATPLRAAMVLDTRFEAQSHFEDDLRVLTGAFLQQRRGEDCVPADGNLRRYIGGLMSPSETLSFDVLCGSSGWRGVHRDDVSLSEGLLSAVDSSGALYESWESLPGAAQQDLQAALEVQP